MRLKEYDLEDMINNKTSAPNTSPNSRPKKS